jgi:adenylate cyclase class IV
MHHVAAHMGYRPTVRIVKIRRTASIGGCSLCIDYLEGVGGFIEAERMTPDEADAQQSRPSSPGSSNLWAPWQPAPLRHATP